MKQMKITSAVPNSDFAFGNQTFGGIYSPPPVTQVEEDVDHDSVDDDHSDAESSSGSENSILIAMASVTLADSEWRSAPSYPPMYLSTVSEYLPPQPKTKLNGAHVTDSTESDGKGSKDISWASEAYEDSLEMDHVFEWFTKRVGYEGEQCVRYVINYL
jgi:pre-rRNA-processing protein TSR4